MKLTQRPELQHICLAVSTTDIDKFRHILCITTDSHNDDKHMSTTLPLHHLDPGPAWPPSQQTYPAHRPLPRQVRAPPTKALVFFVLSAHAEMRGNPDVGEGDLSTLFVAFFTCTPVTCDCRRLSNQSRCTSTRLLSTHDRILGLFWSR